MTAYAAAERAALCDLFSDLGPDAPTLDEGWNAAMLAAHLVLRDRRPDAALGILVPALSGHTATVQQAYAAKPWPELLGLLREGPPRWSPLAFAPRLAESANLVEYFVHTEDLRRAQPEIPPREDDPRLEAALAARLPAVARIVLRSAPVEVTVRSEGRTEFAVGRGPRVTVSGRAPELLLHLLGRDKADRGVVDVQITGEPEAVAAYARLERSL
jgi:uncharacterized protein (TIGR03085 family)